ncbi:MAG: bifunctional adenosylcobinamide kinase/adenosylcobinamide-phosphate guanylyltransferase, partial [Proteobacteria bacterium]|nr:bifunctional adenosylcobinamide kinase/adenosylcobinamide-phosphate guanylyltransferase [Pseudomonadota bacterium]
MSKVLVIGGISSGKSEFAENLALSYREPRLYIATSDIKDEETLTRIEKHRNRRKNLFVTKEEPLFPENFFETGYNIILLDCLTHFYNNIFYYFSEARERKKRV